VGIIGETGAGVAGGVAGSALSLFVSFFVVLLFRLLPTLVSHFNVEAMICRSFMKNKRMSMFWYLSGRRLVCMKGLLFTRKTKTGTIHGLVPFVV
jgi:hypothetical protein